MSILFELAREAGLEIDGEVNTDIVEAASIVWDRNKQVLRASTRREAKAKLRAEVRFGK